MRDVVTKYHCLSLAGCKHRISPDMMMWGGWNWSILPGINRPHAIRVRLLFGGFTNNPSNQPCDNVITCQTWATIGPMLPASSWFWPSSDTLWHFHKKHHIINSSSHPIQSSLHPFPLYNTTHIGTTCKIRLFSFFLPLHSWEINNLMFKISTFHSLKSTKIYGCVSVVNSVCFLSSGLILEGSMENGTGSTSFWVRKVYISNILPTGRRLCI